MGLPEIRIGSRSRLLEASNIDSDPRGIIWLFEPPRPTARYSVAVDPTHALGRNWSRYNRTEDDNRVDNGAIQVVRIGRGSPCKKCNPITYRCASESPNHFIPDFQAAEYAAPIGPEDLAVVVNALGRLYCGRADDNQAPVIIEVYPGPGGPCQRTLMERFGYTNLYQWQFLDTGTESRRKMDFGWYSSRQSVQHLWSKGLRILSRRMVVLRSPWLVEELADCRMDLERNRGAAISGAHDDRVTALLLSLWQGHSFTMGIETDSSSRAEVGPAVEWQRLAISSEKMQEAWDERFEQLSNEAEMEYGY